MREISKGVYYRDSYCSGNVGLVMTDDGAVLIDSPMLPKDAWEWLRKVTSMTKRGIALLINTDYKVERVLGNCFFPANATIAHQSAWTEMQRYDEAFLQRYISHFKDCDASLVADLTKARVVLPELTLTTEMTVYKGERTFHLIHAGGHTQASIMLHLPAERILFAGDVVICGEHPSLAQANSMRWLHTLEIVRKLDDVDVIVPGRGRACDVAATEALTDYIHQMRERVHQCYTEGYTRRETVDRVKMQDFFPAPHAKREDLERRIRSSVERVYDEFKKETEKKRHVQLAAA